MKKSLSIVVPIIVFFLFAVPAYAHVIVTPKTAGIGSSQAFSMSVPNEKDTPTVSIKLQIPQGLKNISPYVKAGWNIEVKKTGSGDSAVITEIDWTGGLIPAGQRDTFTVQAEVPIKAGTLKWKVMQEYQNGEIISWSHDPSKNPEDGNAPPPYSQTNVINDLNHAQDSPAVRPAESKNQTGGHNLSLLLSCVAIALSLAALGMAVKKQ